MDRHEAALPHVPRWGIVGALWLWFAFALQTHYGAQSPYSYAGAVAGSEMSRISGLVVNHDAPSVRPVTQFFYDASAPAYASAHNLKLPFHSALTAATTSYLRSYIWANYLVNVMALWLLAYIAVRFAESQAYPPAATLIAALTCAVLPLYTHYVGQPMHYIVGIVTNFLVMIAVMSGVRDPVRLGLLTAILTLSYDPYVFIAALVTWIAVSIRWTSLRQWFVYVSLALIPVAAWRVFLGSLSDDVVSPVVRDRFILPVVSGWTDVFLQPRDHQLTVFANVHAGLLMAFKMALSVIYWPVLLMCVAALIHSRFRERRLMQVPHLLAIFFVLEQAVTAAYDWENNPRRAIPLLFALSCWYFSVVSERMHLRRWRIAFTAVLVVSFFLTLSDTFSRRPLVGYLSTGEAMRQASTQVRPVAASILDPVYYPKLMSDQDGDVWDVAPARASRPAVLLFANGFVGVFAFLLLSMLAQRSLLPRPVAPLFAALFALSMVARLIG